MATHFYLRNHTTVLLAGAALLAGIVVAESEDDGLGEWKIARRDLSNTWNQPSEHTISPANVGKLAPRWTFTTGGDVSATPTVAGDTVYFPDWSGKLYAVRADDGRMLWSQDI